MLLELIIWSVDPKKLCGTGSSRSLMIETMHLEGLGMKFKYIRNKMMQQNFCYSR